MKIRLKDLELGQLNQGCLRLVFKFVQVLRAETGVSLRMQDKDILNQISIHCRETDSPELRSIYDELKEEILKSMYQKMTKDSSK